jgi:hypothetical protein
MVFFISFILLVGSLLIKFLERSFAKFKYATGLFANSISAKKLLQSLKYALGPFAW